MIPRGRAAMAVGVACLVACGCQTVQTSKSGTWQTGEPITPTSYQVSRERISRGVGKLRRMAVLQVEQTEPKACDASHDPVARLDAVDVELSEELLARQRGYEVIVPSVERHAEWLMPPRSAALMDEVVRWPATVDAFSAGPATRALLGHLQVDEKVDGLLILRVQQSCNNAHAGLRGLLAIGSLGMSEAFPNWGMLQLYKVYRAAVFETRSARVVWQVGQDPIDQQSEVWMGARSKDNVYNDLGHLFETLENATPKILTR